MLTGVSVLVLSAAFVGASQDPALPVPPLQPGDVKIFPLLPPGISGSELLAAKGVEKLALTKEQKADYDKLNAEYKAKHKELGNTTKAIPTETDPEKLRELLKNHVKAQTEAFAAIQKLRPEYLAKVEKLLTDDQKRLFDEVRREAPSPVGPILGVPPAHFGMQRSGQFLPADLQQQLKLSDEQRKKIDEFQKDLETKVLNLLTDDQKKAFEDMRKLRGPGIGILPPNPPVLIPPPPLKKEVEPEPKKIPEPELKKDGK